jgi:hypothetical protein
MVGILDQKKTTFGYLDRNGFEPSTATPQGFDPDVQVNTAADQTNECLWSPTSISFADYAYQKLVTLVLPAPGPIYGVGYSWGNTAHGFSGVDAVPLGTGVAVYNKEGKVVIFLTYHHDVSRWGGLTLGVNGTLDRFYLRYDPSGFLPDKESKTMPSYLDATDAQGNVLQTYTLAALPDSPPAPRTWQRFLTQRVHGPLFYFGTMLYKEIGALAGSTRMRDDLRDQFDRRRIDTAEISAYVALVSLLLAAGAYLWARCTCLSVVRASAWAAFVFALGLPGLIAFRLASDWPRLVPCRSCAKPRPIDEPTCPHCGAGWPVPTPTGTEVFEPTSPALVLEGKAP